MCYVSTRDQQQYHSVPSCYFKDIKISLQANAKERKQNNEHE